MISRDRPHWFVGQDLDGFLGLALDNLIQILLILGLCQGLLGYPPSLVYERILPAIALSLIVGNVYYSWLAYRLDEQEGRSDRTAIPYGINTVSLFAYVFLVMLPVKLTALSQGFSEEAAIEASWSAGLVACLGSGLIELFGAWVSDPLRRWLPRAALLSTLAGIAITFIALGFLFRTYAHPIVGLVPFGVILLTYFGRMKFPIPGGLLAVLLGTALAWITGLSRWDSNSFGLALQPIGWHGPSLHLSAIWESRSILLSQLSVILPMGLFNLVGSLQNLESAEAAGDRYPTKPCLAANGIGTLVAAVCGSCFPTTIYIGHPGWKALGAKVGYSWLNGLVMGAICLTGTVGLLSYFIPIDAGMAIVLWIGIVISAQSFQTTPIAHAPAVVVGLMPGIAAWGAQTIKTSLRIAGLGTAERPFSAALIEPFQRQDLYLSGVLALEQGQIFSAMLLAAMTVYIIDRQFGWAALCSLIAALLSWIGLIHSYEWITSDTVIQLGWGAGSEWAIGYVLLSLLLFYAAWQNQQSHLSKDAEKLSKD
ncbi:NCS2 family permease [Synechococcus elongatus]|uniref:NCS2 family permease n=1 Tax=Synechococcus elongatus PCC 11802 TaxID=2283154 RepID=A0AAT9JYG4_SYNEL